MFGASEDNAEDPSGGLFDTLKEQGFKAAISAPFGKPREAKLPEDGDSPLGGTVAYLGTDAEGVDLGAEAINAKTPEEKYEALRRKHQISLDSPAQLKISGLEDAALVMHTAAARVYLAELEKEREGLPSEIALEQEDVSARRALSALVSTLDELRQAIDCESCALQGLANKIGAPLSKQLRASSAQLEASVANIRQAQASLTVARRSSETALEGRKARAAHFEAAFNNARA